jgi:putative transcriptional regulator
VSTRKSVGEKLIEAMTEFTEALESGEPLNGKLTGHTLSIELTPKRYAAKDVRATRRILGASQSFFARFIGVALGTVRAWEQGRNVPSGAAARLLDEIRLNPEFWKGRFVSVLRRHSTVRSTDGRRASGVKKNRVKKVASGTGSHR